MLQKNSSDNVAAILYADIFDYPLREEEIWKYKISGEFQINEDIVICKNSFFCLKGRENIVKKRIEREKISEEKILFAKKTVNLIKLIPTIKLIGLSGSVAMNNADVNDDIDFFIICKTGTIWLTRLFLLFFLQIMGARRKRLDLKAKNKICINMLIDEGSLTLPQNKHNLYTAHEVMQMKPIFVKEDMYNKFLYQNMWVKNFLPNAINKKEIKKKKEKLKLWSIIPLEFFAKKLQLWYMRNYKTTEITTDTLLAFHPVDHGKIILKEYEKRLKKYEV